MIQMLHVNSFIFKSAVIAGLYNTPTTLHVPVTPQRVCGN